MAPVWDAFDRRAGMIEILGKSTGPEDVGAGDNQAPAFTTSPQAAQPEPLMLSGNAAEIWQLFAQPSTVNAAVDTMAALGFDFLKVYSRLPRDAYFSIARRARSGSVTELGAVAGDDHATAVDAPALG